MTGDVAHRLRHGRRYFEELYAESPDPWGFESRWYERRKFAITVAALPKPWYHHALEPGCARGTLTAKLADRCDWVTAYDFIPEVVEATRARFADVDGVTIVDGELPFVPPGHGDLVVWSEVAYYLTVAGADLAVEEVERWLEPGGDLVAVHYTGETDYPRAGAEVARHLDRVGFLRRTVNLVDEQFELGIWHRDG